MIWYIGVGTFLKVGGGGQTPGVGNVNLLILKYHLSQIVLVEFRPDNKLMPMVSKDIYEEKKTRKLTTFMSSSNPNSWTIREHIFRFSILNKRHCTTRKCDHVAVEKSSLCWVTTLFLKRTYKWAQYRHIEWSPTDTHVRKNIFQMLGDQSDFWPRFYRR